MMNDLAMLVLLIVIIIFVIVLIVLAVHFIGTVRKLNKTIDDIQPAIDSANKMLEDIQPAVKRIDPLMERVSLTVDAVNLEIMRADTILSDISEVTSTATDAVGKVAEITDAPLNLLNAATDKVRDLFGTSKEKRKAEKVVRNTAHNSAKRGETIVEDIPAPEQQKPVTESIPVPEQSARVEEAPVAEQAVEEPAQTDDETEPLTEKTIPASIDTQQNAAVKINYTPDFEPDDDLESDASTTGESEDSEGFYLFYTDDEGIKEGKPKN